MFSQTLLHQGSLALSHELSPLSAVLKLAHDISSVLLWVIWGSPVLKAVKNLVDPSHFLPHIVSCSHLLIFRVLRDNLSPSFDINVVLGLGIFTFSVFMGEIQMLQMLPLSSSRNNLIQWKIQQLDSVPTYYSWSTLRPILDYDQMESYYTSNQMSLCLFATSLVPVFSKVYFLMLRCSTEMCSWDKLFWVNAAHYILVVVISTVYKYNKGCSKFYNKITSLTLFSLVFLRLVWS